jgi:hypothetical protein
MQNQPTMIKKFLIHLFLFLSPVLLLAQHAEITPFGGHGFPATWNAYDGSIKFLGNAQYGGIISLGVSRVVDFNLIYNRIDTKADLYYYGYYDQVPLSVNYIMAGFTKNFRVNPTVSPFVSLSMGACLMDPKEDNYHAYWFFATGMDAGAKIYLSKLIGLRLQAQMYIPVEGASFTFYAGGAGGSSGVSVYSTLVQFGFTGGLIFRIGEIK